VYNEGALTLQNAPLFWSQHEFLRGPPSDMLSILKENHLIRDDGTASRALFFLLKGSDLNNELYEFSLTVCITSAPHVATFVLKSEAAILLRLETDLDVS